MKGNALWPQASLSRLKSRLLSIPTALVFFWIFVLLWGERRIFEQSVAACLWEQWESWPASAQPHHVLLVADPQLVDPHTYPGRPWPLSSLTTTYTDRYLRRSYRYLQDNLQPDATLFLGDLFDGGREWSTLESTSPEKRYRKYGTSFWLNEYLRFSDIFLRAWRGGSSASRAEPMGRRLVASVPGNHDLGFAAGIQLPVKERFDAYFGPLNRIDIIGNHSFVLLDTVSLSAMDQIDPKTGSSGAGDGSAAATSSSKIWKPVEDFLVEAKTVRAKAIQHTCETQFEWEMPQKRQQYLEPEVRLADDQSPLNPPKPPQYPISSSQFPTIVLSHVPLYRSGETTCGPLRERGSAIPIQAGYQYQNVLTPLISQDIVKHLTPEEITMIYSGDDHDYCEIEHHEFTGRIKEITVKSMSWAMGIRKPGVQLVSLWNPVDASKVLSSSDDPNVSTPRDTVQNRMCLLPDQLSIFIHYAQALGATLFMLLVSTIRYNPSAAQAQAQAQREKSEPLLPTTEDSYHHHHRHADDSNRSSSSCVQNAYEADSRLSTRKQNINTTNTTTTTNTHGSSYGGYGHIPPSSRTPSPSKEKDKDRETPAATFPPYISYARNAAPPFPEETDDWGIPKHVAATLSLLKTRSQMPPKSRLEFLRRSLWRTAWPVLVVYLFLIWTG